MIASFRSSHRRRLMLSATLAAPLLAAAISTAPCQVITASLRGTVVDPSGAIVPGAAVKATNTSTNVVTEAKSDENGRFVFASLAPGGPYTLSITAQGFKGEERTGITPLSQPDLRHLSLVAGGSSLGHG